MSRRVLLRLFPDSHTAVLLRLAALALLCLGIVGLLPSAASAAQYAPVAAYSFDEDKGEAIEDVVGENNGTVEGAKWTPHGHYGGAMEFINYESCTKIPDSPALRGGEEFTLEAWVRPTTVHEFMPIFYKQRGEDYAYGLWFDEMADGKPEGEINDGNWPIPYVKAEAKVPLDAWSHLALSFDGAHIRLYINGELVATAASEAPLANEGPLEIGCADVYGNEDHFEGRIDEARIYDRSLSQAEIAGDMEAPLQTPKAGPVAAWSFDEGKGSTATDITGHRHTATISKATWTRGRFGDGLKFDGKNSCVTVAASPELDFEEEFTLEAWVRPVGSKKNSGPVMAQIDETPPPGEESFAYNFLAGENEVPHAWVRKAGGGVHNVYGTENLPQNTWAHLVLTDDGAHLRLYVDGVLVNTAPAAQPIGAEGPLQIGCHTSEYHFEGRIDEVRLYDRALNLGEVDSDMESPVQTPKTGPVADYSFDEGTGETAEDLTGDGHTATLQGAEWTPHGRFGGALEFDAEEEDFVSIPASGALDGSEELTVEAWVRPTAEPEYGSILMKEREGSGPRYSYVLYQHDDQTSGYFHESEEGILISPEHSLPSDTWTHLAITDNGSASHLYVDGVLVGTAPALPIEGHGEIRLGGNSIWGEYFDGRIDEVRIYDRSLAPAEVAVDMETPLATSKAGPVADYSFDQDPGEGSTIEDLSGHGHTATIHGAKWTPAGRYGGGMNFNPANNDYLSVPDSAELDFEEEFTLEAWVRPEEGDGHWGPVISKEIPGHEGLLDYAYYLYEGDWEENRPGGGIFEGSYIHDSSALPVHAWAHLAITYDGHIERLYVNGQLVSEDTSAPPQVSKGELQIGGSTEQGNSLNGRLDEVRIYNRALNVAEVDSDMAAPIQTPQQGPIAAWSFDEVGEGGSVEDVTGNGHTGTVEGATLVRGKYGEALQFDGENDVVKVPSSPEFALTEGFTLEAWVRPESESNEWAPILAKELGGGEGANRLAWWLYEAASNTNLPFGGTEPSPGNWNAAYADDPLPVNVWSHLAVTYDGAKIRLFVNGELVDCSPVPAGAPPVTNGEVQIGGVTEHGEYFKGRIDEVRIYNRAVHVTPESVSRMMDVPMCRLNSGEAGQNAIPTRSSLPGGGFAVSYALGDGTTVSVPHPPSEFDPLTASQESLEEYGLPPRPSSPGAARTEWEEEMSTLGEQSDQLCVTSTENLSEPDSGSPLLPEAEEETSEEEGEKGQAPAWSGFVSAYFKNPEKFRAVEGTFVQPTTFSGNCSNAKVSSWVGIGGYNGAKGLMQAGVTVEPDDEIYPWYEWLHGDDPKNIPPEPITQLKGVVEPHHVVHVRVSYNTTTHKAFFFENDLTAEKPGWMIVRPFNEKWYNGKTAEWVNERGSVNNHPIDLKRFSPVAWSGARAEESDGTLKALGQLDRTRLSMKVGSNAAMAIPSTLESAEAFTTRFKRCSPS
jgi:hypothetical protein